ncbi:uncharacterized protein LOC119290771 [Triticum dicoccoides]|uniref:uncharacterized protein LOC119290771 n=1 Tax=Triticum dicoccoides TaxID=85692 RepID=UPI00188F8920|nr:uncharacterized protein LOC119290771 [Triticum dicoccoides]XP_044408683.1 uncharacterized protein LOC123133226 [Triticum aestivum]
MAGEALGDAASASSFLCSADELRFDAPARALAAEEALQPVWLYFASSASTRPPVRWRPRRRCSPGGSTSRCPCPCSAGRSPGRRWPPSPSRPAPRSPSPAVSFSNKETVPTRIGVRCYKLNCSWPES